jgi:hypothetical protein
VFRVLESSFLAAETTPSDLPCDVEGMANDVAFSKLSMKAAIGIGTTARYASTDFHTCLMTEEVMEIQEY